MSKELNCMNCCIGDFKESLCDCNNGMCKEYKKVGRAEDFEKEVLKRTKPKTWEWIPCSERLPSEDGQYFVCMDSGQMDVYMWAEGWNCIRRLNSMVTREYEIDGIVAWMPLPEPYREDGEE